ncbi:MAG: B12-binding domain-containing protein [Chloroflexota bacterium]
MKLKLGNYSTTPLYNIKAVVQVTDISPSTLRAWERRYDIGAPERSASGYRLYSDRDVAIIRWLKQQVDAGMSISQAVSWYRKLVEEADDVQTVVLPDKNTNILAHRDSPNGVVNMRTSSSNVRSFPSLQKELLEALINFEENSAEHLLTEAFSLYTLEEVGDNLISPVLVEIGEKWHNGQLSITREHYATNYLRQRLVELLRTAGATASGPLVWIGCAPGELHEIGAIMLCIYVRRAGYQVHYLGQDLPYEDLIEEVRLNQPAMILFSASTKETGKNLGELTKRLSDEGPSGLIIGYGGRIFNKAPELRTDVTGVFLGATAQEAVDTTKEILGR